MFWLLGYPHDFSPSHVAIVQISSASLLEEVEVFRYSIVSTGGSYMHHIYFCHHQLWSHALHTFGCGPYLVNNIIVYLMHGCLQPRVVSACAYQKVFMVQYGVEVLCKQAQHIFVARARWSCLCQQSAPACCCCQGTRTRTSWSVMKWMFSKPLYRGTVATGVISCKL